MRQGRYDGGDGADCQELIATEECYIFEADVELLKDRHGNGGYQGPNSMQRVSFVNRTEWPDLALGSGAISPSNANIGAVTKEEQHEITLIQRPIEWVVGVVGRLRDQHSAGVIPAFLLELGRLASHSILFQSTSPMDELAASRGFEDSECHDEGIGG